MKMGVMVFIYVILLGYIPASTASKPQRLVVRGGRSPVQSSKPVGFELVFIQRCHLNSTQHTSKSNLIGCYAAFTVIGVVCLISVIVLILIGIFMYWQCHKRQSKERKQDLEIVMEGSDQTDTDETTEEEISQTRLSTKVSSMLKKFKISRKPVEVQRTKISYERLPQEEQLKLEEETAQEISQSKERNEARRKQEQIERARAELSEKLFKDTHRYYQHCPDLGSRLQKYWLVRRKKRQRWSALQFTAKISKKCPFPLDDQENIKILNQLFRDLRHPYLQEVYQVAYLEDYVSVLQKFIPEGSLRDRTYNVDPIQDWSEKYTFDTSIEILDVAEVATCVRHILEALLVLYDVGFPAVGQVHTGNVFLEDGRYVLGGFENTLLGYRTSQYADIKKEGLLDSIDIIMLGHLVYEISSGKYLQEICPSKSFAFDKVENRDIREFIKFIFSMDSRKTNKNAIKQLLNHSFVKDVDVEKRPPLEISPQAKELIEVFTHQDSAMTIPGAMSHSDLDITLLMEKVDGNYTNGRTIERIGWRPEKVWGTAQHGRWGEVLLSAALVPYTCPIYVQTNMNEIKEILDKVQQHPNIHAVLEIYYLKESGRHITVSVEFLKKLSIRDFLYKSNPLEIWENKYKKPVKHFNTHQIASYGSQVLDALLFLYNLGFPPIGQVTSGNIFINGDICQLGGQENVLLGHRTEFYTSIKECAGPAIDIFMFGSVLLEMATGRAMTTLPTSQDYKHEAKELKDILEYVFELNYSIAEIRNHSFFIEVRSDSEKQAPSLSKNAQDLLQKVRKGKWRKQDDSGGKIKDKIKTSAFRTWKHLI